ncbi:hypothetical protein V498_07964, partial [Pseudogymnoascus sp. VKM F-4517 (FW-2822)]
RARQLPRALLRDGGDGLVYLAGLPRREEELPRLQLGGQWRGDGSRRLVAVSELEQLDEVLWDLAAAAVSGAVGLLVARGSDRV